MRKQNKYLFPAGKSRMQHAEHIVFSCIMGTLGNPDLDRPRRPPAPRGDRDAPPRGHLRRHRRHVHRRAREVRPVPVLPRVLLPRAAGVRAGPQERRGDQLGLSASPPPCSATERSTRSTRSAPSCSRRHIIHNVPADGRAPRREHQGHGGSALRAPRVPHAADVRWRGTSCADIVCIDTVRASHLPARKLFRRGGREASRPP